MPGIGQQAYVDIDSLLRPGFGHAKQGASFGHPVDTDDLVTITPYITHTIRRMGDLVLKLSPPEEAPVTRLDLEPRVLFAPRT